MTDSWWKQIERDNEPTADLMMSKGNMMLSVLHKAPQSKHTNLDELCEEFF